MERHKTPKTLDFVAIDLILNSNREIKVIEINAYPADILLASSFNASTSAEDGSATLLNKLCLNLCAIASTSRTNVLVFSGRYRFSKCCVDLESVVGKSVSLETCISDPEPGFERYIVAEMNAIQDELRSLGVRCAIMDQHQISAISEMDGTIQPNILFHRGVLRSSNLYSKRDKIKEYVCADKLLLNSLNWSTLPNWLVPSIKYDIDTVPAFVEKNPSEYYILKPRFGFGSMGVKRISKEQIISPLNKENYFLEGYNTNDFVLQPWIESFSTSRFEERKFDIRAHALDGKIVSLYVRNAAGVLSECTKDSELSWLTTLGSTQEYWEDFSVYETILSDGTALTCRLEEIVSVVEERICEYLPKLPINQTTPKYEVGDEIRLSHR